MIDLDIGFFKIDITPPVGVRLGGYGHRLGLSSTHIIDPLFLRVLYLSNRSGEAVVIAQLDLLGLYRDDADVIREILSKRLGVKREDVMIATTHTHSAPETIIPMWTHTFPYTEEQRELYDSWRKILFEKTGEVSEDLVYTVSRVVSMRSGSRKVPGLCFNRAFRDGLIDDELSIIGFESRDLRVVVANYACHPVTNVSLGISADYPGEIHYQLSRRGIETIFLTGACGDIDPIQKGVRYMIYLGSVLSEEILSLYLTSREEIYSEDLSSSMEEITFGVRRPSRSISELMRDYETLRNLYKDPRNLLFDSSWMDLLYLDEELDLAEKKINEIKTILQIIRIGDKNLVIGIPGEILSETSIELKKNLRDMGYMNILVSTYTNDYIGYIPIERSFLENKYEARLAKWSFVERDAERKLREKILDVVKRLKLK